MAISEARRAEALELLRRLDAKRHPRSLGRTLAKDALVAALVVVAMVAGFWYGLTL